MQKEYVEEYRKIGGIEQYLLHYPVKDAPVLLMLHGGPGSAESGLSYLFHQWWRKKVTLVQYDQRGCGKTLRRNPDTSAYPVSTETMLSDLGEIVAYLKEKYHQEKIVLMGHSWGTVLGAVYAGRHPEDVSLYIAVGQVVSMQENERTGFQKALEMAEKAGNRKDVEKLRGIGEYPPQTADKAGIKKINSVRKLQQKYGLSMGLSPELVRVFSKSPVFHLSDAYIMLFKAGKASQPLLEELLHFDLETAITGFDIPVCCIQGDRDYQTATPLATAYYETVRAPARQIHVIPDAGHAPMMDQKERFADALEAALGMLNERADGAAAYL